VPVLAAVYVEELRRREKELGIEPDPEVDALLKAEAVEGKRINIVTDLILRVLGLEVGHNSRVAGKWWYAPCLVCEAVAAPPVVQSCRVVRRGHSQIHLALLDKLRVLAYATTDVRLMHGVAAGPHSHHSPAYASGWRPVVLGDCCAGAVISQKACVLTACVLVLYPVLQVCADTQVGNQMIRGVSGGQRKRVTTGEVGVSSCRRELGLILVFACSDSWQASRMVEIGLSLAFLRATVCWEGACLRLAVSGGLALQRALIAAWCDYDAW
jgi:hypothetical protein